jgi:HPt (histidine-containing phosphotransfer) domain-containing protein
MLHTLAGAAGNLGAKEIWRLATELEHALGTREQSENILRLNEALEQELAYLAWSRSIVFDN